MDVSIRSCQVTFCVDIAMRDPVPVRGSNSTWTSQYDPVSDLPTSVPMIFILRGHRNTSPKQSFHSTWTLQYVSAKPSDFHSAWTSQYVLCAICLHSTWTYQHVLCADYAAAECSIRRYSTPKVQSWLKFPERWFRRCRFACFLWW